MAKVFLDAPMMTLSGSLRKNDDFYFFSRNGKTFTGAKGTRIAPVTQNEMAARQRFRRAIDWANLVQKNDEMFLHYVSMWHASDMKCKTFRGWLIKYYFKQFK